MLDRGNISKYKIISILPLRLRYNQVGKIFQVYNNKNILSHDSIQKH